MSVHPRRHCPECGRDVAIPFGYFSRHDPRERPGRRDRPGPRQPPESHPDDGRPTLFPLDDLTAPPAEPDHPDNDDQDPEPDGLS